MTEKQEIYRGRKFHQVCKGARQVFLRDGYEGASVDDISRAAGVSKATLYSYFPHKRLMFEEMMRNEIAAVSQQMPASPDPSLPPPTGLPLILVAMTHDAIGENHVGLYRLGVAEARRFPQLAQDYFNGIVQQHSAALVDYLEYWVARGELDISDTGQAAEQLWCLTGATLARRSALLPQGSVTDSDIEEACSAAIDLFLKAYADNRTIPAAAQ